MKIQILFVATSKHPSMPIWLPICAEICMPGYKAPRLEGMKSTSPLRCLLVKLNCTWRTKLHIHMEERNRFYQHFMKPIQFFDWSSWYRILYKKSENFVVVSFSKRLNFGNIRGVLRITWTLQTLPLLNGSKRKINFSCSVPRLFDFGQSVLICIMP